MFARLRNIHTQAILHEIPLEHKGSYQVAGKLSEVHIGICTLPETGIRHVIFFDSGGNLVYSRPSGAFESYIDKHIDSVRWPTEEMINAEVLASRIQSH